MAILQTFKGEGDQKSGFTRKGNGIEGFLKCKVGAGVNNPCFYVPDHKTFGRQYKT